MIALARSFSIQARWWKVIARKAGPPTRRPWSSIARKSRPSLPVVAIVVAFERRIIEGLTAGAVKG